MPCIWGFDVIIFWELLCSGLLKLSLWAKSPHYNKDNIANKFTYITGDREGRTTILLVNEELGF